MMKLLHSAFDAEGSGENVEQLPRWSTLRMAKGEASRSKRSRGAGRGEARRSAEARGVSAGVR